MEIRPKYNKLEIINTDNSSFKIRGSTIVQSLHTNSLNASNINVETLSSNISSLTLDTATFNNLYVTNTLSTSNALISAIQFTTNIEFNNLQVVDQSTFVNLVHLNSGIILHNSSNTSEGMLRFNNNKFQGHNQTQWVNLDAIVGNGFEFEGGPNYITGNMLFHNNLNVQTLTQNNNLILDSHTNIYCNSLNSSNHINISNTNSNLNGTIKFTGTDFLAKNTNNYNSLTILDNITSTSDSVTFGLPSIFSQTVTFNNQLYLQTITNIIDSSTNINSNSLTLANSLNVSSTLDETTGNIQFNSGMFQGYNGEEWKNFKYIEDNVNVVIENSTATNTGVFINSSMDNTTSTIFGINSKDTSIGNNNLSSIQTPKNNTTIGYNISSNISTANNNIIIGNNTTISNNSQTNTIIGHNSYASNSNNIIIGHNNTSTGHNTILIGSNITAGTNSIILSQENYKTYGDNCIILGNSSVTGDDKFSIQDSITGNIETKKLYVPEMLYVNYTPIMQKETITKINAGGLTSLTGTFNILNQNDKLGVRIVADTGVIDKRVFSKFTNQQLSTIYVNLKYTSSPLTGNIDIEIYDFTNYLSSISEETPTPPSYITTLATLDASLLSSSAEWYEFTGQTSPNMYPKLGLVISNNSSGSISIQEANAVIRDLYPVEYSNSIDSWTGNSPSTPFMAFRAGMAFTDNILSLPVIQNTDSSIVTSNNTYNCEKISFTRNYYHEMYGQTTTYSIFSFPMNLSSQPMHYLNGTIMFSSSDSSYAIAHLAGSISYYGSGDTQILLDNTTFVSSFVEGTLTSCNIAFGEELQSPATGLITQVGVIECDYDFGTSDITINGTLSMIKNLR